MRLGIEKVLATYKTGGDGYDRFFQTCNAILPDPNYFNPVFDANVEAICPEMMRLFTEAYLAQ